MPANDAPTVATILLAAGESRRMGTQKQLLLINGKPMVRIAAERARQASTGPLIVVLGSNAEEVRRVIDGLDQHHQSAQSPTDTVCVVNPDWAEGMGASLRHGLQTLFQTAPKSSAVLIMLADQPGISAAHLTALIERHRSHPGKIIATESGGVAQPPVIFPDAWFPRLSTLQGDRGARAILREAGAEVQLVHAEAIDDVDTPDDYQNFINRSANK